MWAFATCGHKIAVEIIGFLSATNVLDEGLNGIYTALVTKSIPCSYNNQRFYGNATAPSTDYPEGFLVGTYAVVKNGTQSKVITGGYTVRDWGQPTFGRMMLYRVFGIDDTPTSWSNMN